MKIAVLYARFSTEHQSELSIADQLRVGREYASRHGWVVAEQYVDEGISGAALGNRPSAQRMVEDGFARKYDILIVMELLRLARGEDLPKLIQRLKFRGVRIIGVQDGFDSEARTARMQAGMAGIMGGEFIEMISRRVHSSLEMRAKDQRPTGGRAYGYNNARQPVEPEAAIVREIFRRHAAGESMKAIASDLNARGIPSPGATWKRDVRRKDGRWLVSGVHTILHNELYIGRVIWNRREFRKDPDTGIRTCRERPRSEWIIHESPELALIDAETWRLSQSRLGTKGGGQQGPVRYMLSGLLECGICGSKFIVYGGKGHRYVCGSHHGGGDHACSNGISVRRDVAEELILAPVLDDLLHPATLDAIAEFMRREERRAQIKPVITPDVSRIDAEIAELEKLVQAGVLSSARAAPALEAAQRDRQQALKAATRQGADVAHTTNELIEAYREEAMRMRHVLQGPDVNAARLALREVLGAVKLIPRGPFLEANFQRGSLGILRLTEFLVANGGSTISIENGGFRVDTSESHPRYHCIYPPILLVKPRAK